MQSITNKVLVDLMRVATYLGSIALLGTVLCASAVEVVGGALPSRGGLWSPDDQYAVQPQTMGPTPLALKDTVNIAMIYVAFPDMGDCRLPEFWRELEGTFYDFFLKMSQGRHHAVLRTVRRSEPNAALCFVADSTHASFLETGSLGMLSMEVVTKATLADTAAIATADVLFIAFMQDCLPRISGQARLPFSGFQLYDGPGAVVDIQPPEVFEGLLAHEYGHLVGFRHPPEFECTNLGDYGLMDAKIHRLVPFCVQNLYEVGWLSEGQVVEVTDRMENVPLADVRRGGKVYRLFATDRQYFWICNHQGTDYDSTYVGKGLLIWHIQSPGYPRVQEIWDVESAQGLFSDGQPDPVLGVDSLDISFEHTGSSSDFFNLHSKMLFGGQTNPSTHAYRRYEDSWRQDRPTGVSVEIVAERDDTIFVNIVVPNELPEFGRCFLLSAAVSTVGPYAIEAEIHDDHGVERALLYYRTAPDSGFHTAEMSFLGSHLWQGKIPSQPLNTTIEYYLQAWDASDSTTTLPKQAPDSLLFSRVWKPAEVALHQDKVELVVHKGEVKRYGLQLGNVGQGTLYFDVKIVPSQGEALEVLSPLTDIIPTISSSLEPARWRDAYQIAVYDQNSEKFGTIFVKNSLDALFIRKEWHFFSFDDDFVTFVQFEVDRSQPDLIVAWSRLGGEEVCPPDMIAESANCGSGSDAEGRKCVVFEAAVPLEYLGVSADSSFGIRFSAAWLSANKDERLFVRWPIGLTEENAVSFAPIQLSADVPWLTVAPGGGTISPGSVATLRLTVDASAGTFLPGQWAEARLVIGTNTLAARQMNVPVHVHMTAEELMLYPSYPNPFNDRTTISFQVVSSCSDLSLCVFDVLGRRVATLAEGPHQEGFHRITWDGRGDSGVLVPSGVYFVRLRTDGRKSVRKILYVR